MRIGIDVCGLGSAQRYSGMGEYAFQLATHLPEIDTVNEYYLISDTDGGLPRPASNVHHVFLSQARLGKWSALLSHQFALPRLAGRLKLDVLHIPWVHVRPSQPSVPWHVPCPLVVTLHDVIPLAYYQRHDPASFPRRLAWFYRLNLRLAGRAACLLTDSEYSRQDIISFTAIPPERIQTVHCGVDFAPIQLPPEMQRQRREALGLPDRYLLYAGSYEPRKNLRGTLTAYARAVAAGVDWPLVAIVERESGHALALREHARTLQLGERLILMHSVPQDDLRFIYSGAELFLFPSFYEGFGLPPLQAMNCGIPVIASRASSLPEVLGKAAYYVDPQQTDQIASAILTLLDNRALRDRLTALGIAQAARYRWTQTASETLAIYRQVAHG